MWTQEERREGAPLVFVGLNAHLKTSRSQHLAIVLAMAMITGFSDQSKEKV